jgi:hypothetical protein
MMVRVSSWKYHERREILREKEGIYENRQEKRKASRFSAIRMLSNAAHGKIPASLPETEGH